MAAYAALVSLMNDLDDIQNHPRHSFSFDNKQITSLSQTVEFLIDFLESHNSHECSTESMESRIASAAHAAHDVIDSHVLNQIHAGSTLLGKVRSYFLLDLQKAINNMDFFRRKAMQFKARSGFLKAEKPAYSAVASNSEMNIMVGFDAVRDQLLDRLTGNPSGPRQVIPLVGMGGIGKTTLAKNVYDHSSIKYHFDVFLWATISQQYSVETIITQLSTTGSGDELRKKKLWGRRYLIVLDDMWSIEAWEEIEWFMPDNGNGSCVIVTTRLSNLTAHLSSSPFEMNFLDEDKSWELFCAEAFGQEKCPLEFEKIGKRIVKRCRGLPLSIIVIGGHLRKSSRAIEYWEKVASLMNPISSSVDDDQCLQIISLSYHHLPPYLRPCFLSMGIYDEDKWIDVSVLFNLWIAEGFLRPKKSLSLEEVAEEYLNDLIERNLVLIHKKWNGKVIYCGIHDSVRELCLKVGKKEKFIHRESCTVLQHPEWKHQYRTIGDAHWRLVRSRVGIGDFSRQLGFGFRRVSGFVKDGRCVEAAHFQLHKLRYLFFFQIDSHILQPLEDNRCCMLSPISLFWNVKTLIIRNHACDIIVPFEIWEMPQLRHLESNGICLPNPLPNQEECIVLQNLHTLLGVRDLSLSEEVCKRIPNIKNLYVVYHVDFPGDFEAICPHNVGLLNKLEHLQCMLYGNADSKCRDFFLSFTFPNSLKKLSLDCPLLWDGLTMMMKSLPHIEHLKLWGIKGPEWHLVAEFPRLKFLRIDSCDDLIYWNANNSHFPILEILDIYQAPELSEIPFDIGEISTLQRINLYYCSMSAAISAMRIVVEQESLGNQDIQLHIFFKTQEQELRFQKMVQEQGLRSNSVRRWYSEH